MSTMSNSQILFTIRERLNPEVRVRLDEEFGLSKPGQKTSGRLPKALKAIDKALIRKDDVANRVRRWIVRNVDQNCRPNHAALGVIVANVLDEARVRAKQYKETPLEALSHAVALNTAIYQDGNRNYAQIKQSATDSFRGLFA